ncbi:MAG: glycosyltransferase family 2 protein [Clostridia bacterium]|nr:glycosyltransferase family 2 protein [Clostridia bacterium]
MTHSGKTGWMGGGTPVAVIMISLNEGHNMESVLRNLQGWAQEVHLVDSYSADETVDIALRYGVHVIQRKFRGFGDQWNFALRELPISAPWTMKLDPDERLTDELKAAITQQINTGEQTGISFYRRLWFMGKPLPMRQEVVRVWKTGRCQFTNVAVNEHPVVEGQVVRIDGMLEHLDSPDLHHWVEKQNRYSSVEAISFMNGHKLSVAPRLFGPKMARRMWFKHNYMKIPFRYFINYLINLIIIKVWSSGKVGLTWARLRVWVRRMKEDKIREMIFTGKIIDIPATKTGTPHPRAIQVK